MRALVFTCTVVAAVSVGARDRARIHVVEPGQTLWSIAYHHGVKVETLVRLNRISDPSQLSAGTELLLPDNAHTAPHRSPPSPAVDDPELHWPLRGRLTSPYGRRGRGHHTGIDIAATKGTIIVAAAGGTVVRAGDRWGRYGRVVLLDHGDGTKTLYAHLSRPFVRKGQRVVGGQAIAAVGATGNATGPHLHFEVWRGDQSHDPMRYLATRPGTAVAER